MRYRLTILALLASSLGAVAQNPVKIPLSCEATDTAISPSGKHVAVRCKDSSVHLMSVPEGKEVTRLPAADRYAIFDFSRDGTRFAVGYRSGVVVVVNTENPAAPKQWHAADHGIEVLKFVAPNSIAAGTVSDPAQVWDFSSTPTPKATLATDFAGLTAVAASPDRKYLVTTGADTVVRFYDASTWKMIAEYRDFTLEPFAANFTNDGKYAVVGGADRQLTLFDPATGKKVRSLPVQPDPVQAIDSIDSSRLAVLYADADGRKPPHLQVWDLNSGSSKPLPMDASVTGGAVVQGHIWLARTNAGSLELIAGN